MASVREQEIHFDGNGVVRVQVVIDTHRDGYSYSLIYASEQQAIGRIDADVAELLLSAQLRADVQDELDRPVHWQASQRAGFALRPVDRRALVVPVHLAPGANFLPVPEVRLILGDEVSPGNAELEKTLTPRERVFRVCSRGCLYIDDHPGNLAPYLAQHYAGLQLHLDKLTARAQLLSKIRGRRQP